MNHQKLLFLLGGSLAVCLSLLGNTDWHQRISATTAPLVSVAFGNDTFVAVGESIVYSSDTVEWHESADGSNHVLHQVIFADGRFVAVGRGTAPYEPRLLTSTDGALWHAALLPAIPDATNNPPVTLRSIAFREGVWIAVGDEGAILRSEDGLSWSAIAGVSAKHLTAVVATDAGFTALAEGSIYESATGSDWAASPAEGGIVAQAVFAEGRFLGRHGHGAKWSSLDGRSRMHLAGNNASGIGYAGGLFVGVGTDKLWLSQDLVESAEIPFHFSAPVRALAASEEAVIAVGGSGAIFARDDLWSPVVTVQPTRDRHPYPAGSTLQLEVTALGSGALLYQWSKDNEELPGQDQPRLEIEGLASSDSGAYSVKISSEFGETTSASVQISVATTMPVNHPAWMPPVSLPTSVTAVAFGNGRYIGVTDTVPAKILHSRDGVTWRDGTMPANLYMGNIAFGDGHFLAGGWDPSLRRPVIVHSPDGGAWAFASLPEGLNGPVFAVAWGNGAYVASGPGWALRSEDGKSWQLATGAQGHHIRSIAFGDGFFSGSIWRHHPALR